MFSILQRGLQTRLALAFGTSQTQNTYVSVCVASSLGPLQIEHRFLKRSWIQVCRDKNEMKFEFPRKGRKESGEGFWVWLEREILRNGAPKKDME